MTEFTPFASLIGGIMIGLAAVAMMGFFGRIAGISGILGAIVDGSFDTWRVAFIGGLVLSGIGFAWLAPDPIEVTHNPVILIAGGLLVGIGTRIGAGCTSGHGVCGMSRISMRSIAATIAFMLVAILTVVVTRHILGAV